MGFAIEWEFVNFHHGNYKFQSCVFGKFSCETSLTSLTGDGFMDEQVVLAQDPVQITHRNPTQVSTSHSNYFSYNNLFSFVFLEGSS